MPRGGYTRRAGDHPGYTAAGGEPIFEHGANGPVTRPRLRAAADQVRVLRAEPGRDAAFAVGDDERVAAPCADSVTSTRNSNSRFACRWLRAGATTPRPPTRTADVRYRRRWIVERTIGWLGHFRGLTVRYDRSLATYGGFFHLACALLVLRRVLK